MNRIKAILKNEYIFSILSRFISLAISLLQSILVARYLGAELQGVNSYILSIVSIGAIIITFGMHQAYPYFRKKYGKEYIYQNFFTLTILLYSFYFVASIFISLLFKSNIEIMAAIILIPLYGYGRVVAYITLIEKPNSRNLWWTIAAAIDVVFVILLMLFIEKSLITALSILIFAEALKAVIYTVILWTKPKFNKDLFNLLGRLFMMGFFPMIALLLTTLNYKIDVIMLRNFEFITDAQVGVYAIGMNFADKVVMIPDTLKGVLASKLSKGADEHEVARISRLCFWSSILICIAFLVLGETVINLLYGQEYDGAYQVLLICASGSIFVGYFKLIAQYNIINKKQIRNVVLLSGSIIVNVILNFILIPVWQLNGAAFASGVGYLLTGLIFVFWFAIKNHIRIDEMFLPQKEDFLYFKKLLGRRKKNDN